MKKILLLFILILHGELTMALTLTTPAFNDNEYIPADYTCQGQNNTPPLYWSNPPEGTQSYALIMDDPDATSDLWIHWNVFNIPANINHWPFENTNAVDGNNSWGKTGYGGPCPPAGKDHHYVFTLYALDTLLNLSQGSTAAQVRKAIEGHVLEQTQMIGVYRRS